TFEQNRRLCPLTVPVLVHAETWFVVHASTGTLPARGKLGPFDRIRKERCEKAHGKRRDQTKKATTECRVALRVGMGARGECKLGPFDRIRKERYEKAHGKRRNQSKKATTECVVALREALGERARFTLQTDQKSTYPGIFRRTFGGSVLHQWVNSKERRDRKNLLFTINNTFAQARDGMSGLVRRNWGHSKLERNLRWHLGAWILWRNYAREITCASLNVSSASATG